MIPLQIISCLLALFSYFSGCFVIYSIFITDYLQVIFTCSTTASFPFSLAVSELLLLHILLFRFYKKTLDWYYSYKSIVYKVFFSKKQTLRIYPCSYHFQCSSYFCVDPYFHLTLFPSASRTYHNIPSSVGLLVTNSFSFDLSETGFMFISFFLLKDIFAGYKILTRWCFFFACFTDVTQFITCIVCYEKYPSVLIFVSL